MSLANYIASYSILDLSAKQLQSLCAKMKLEGHGKLDNRHRVELFLRQMGKSEDYITEVLSKLPERKKKVKQDEAEEEAWETGSGCTREGGYIRKSLDLNGFVCSYQMVETWNVCNLLTKLAKS